LKEIERKLISELLKNSRRSDRELAKAIGVSQPTTTRLRTKLEKEGYIKEYTMIPDFAKLGYGILALTFVKLRGALDAKEVEGARKIARESLDAFLEVIMLERGMGINYDGVIVSYHENYGSYQELRNKLKQFTFLDLSKIEAFLINLHDKVCYRSLTLATLAKHLLAMKDKE